MKRYKIIHKDVGQTPLEAVELFRSNNPKLEIAKLAYAGRLDPMASGKLLVLIGEECKKQEKYLQLDKEYIFEVLFGFTSDTGDVLGLTETGSIGNKVSDEELESIANKMIGSISLEYPVFSSKTVQGKHLFMWALEEKLNEIEIPSSETEIYKLLFLGTRELNKKQIKERIFEKIESISTVSEESKSLGRDFRRTEIMEQWENVFSSIEHESFQVAKFSCVCSSGTYMRSLSGEIGERAGVKGLAYEIQRTQIGKYKRITKNMGFWQKRF